MKTIVVLVEEVEVARTALQWALHNLINYDDLIILLHVFQPSPTKISSSSSSRHNNNTNHHNKKQRVLRLKGFQLALSFKLLCDHTIPDAKVDIAVREGDQAGDGTMIASTIREMGASALVVGIHDQSFLYKMARTNTTIINNLNCRVLAIKQPMETSTTSGENSTNFDFSQIEIGRLSLPPIPPQKIPYQILPSPFRIIWRSKRRRQEHHHQQNTGC